MIDWGHVVDSKRLKDYKGYEILKTWEYDRTSVKYTAYEKDCGNWFCEENSLKELKRTIDKFGKN